MELNGKWYAKENGTLEQIDESSAIKLLLSEKNKELFLNIDGNIIDIKDIGERNKVFLKAFYKFLKKASYSLDTATLLETNSCKDIEVTKTAVNSVTNYMLFGGKYEDIPNYIKSVL